MERLNVKTRPNWLLAVLCFVLVALLDTLLDIYIIVVASFFLAAVTYTGWNLSGLGESLELVQPPFLAHLVIAMLLLCAVLCVGRVWLWCRKG